MWLRCNRKTGSCSWMSFDNWDWWITKHGKTSLTISAAVKNSLVFCWRLVVIKGCQPLYCFVENVNPSGSTDSLYSLGRLSSMWLCKQQHLLSKLNYKALSHSVCLANQYIILNFEVLLYCVNLQIYNAIIITFKLLDHRY